MGGRDGHAPDLLTPVRHLAETYSTNADVRATFISGDQDPLWIIADKQLAGRGRSGRVWHHHPGNFAGTLLWSVSTEHLRNVGALSFMAGLSVADAAIQFGVTADMVRLKWPNDVQIAGGKFSGILIEGLGAGRNGQYGVAIGIGANLAEAPKDLDYLCTAISDVSEDIPSPRQWLSVLDQAWRRRWEQFSSDGFGPIRSAWLERATGMGANATVKSAGRMVTGTLLGIDATGAAVIRTADGDETVTAGDLSFGPAPS